ncbi:MAG: trifunctional serine/threonine-protein kinase/ATP-binding protein/sensor histidine kinase [Calothrix sp. MO_167.B12]|nr:trifunctional serine/threonine-protein kinase/ATP-binding protein/sensor histidine kinase [Calothrix sp. MO_167.B12]
MLTSTLVPGYELSKQIHEGSNTIVYQGTSNLEQQPVIIKILKSDYPTLEAITRLKHEYQITANLDLEGIVKLLRLETHQNRLALIFEDFGGISLDKFLHINSKDKGEGREISPLSLETFFSIALQLTKALVSLNNHQIIHKDIKPANIIINPQTGLVKLTDFSIASRLAKETLQLSHPNQLEGTLAYISPEQTGRMNRILDYRTDFYSLGITFYEILTGELPFQSNDPLELVHCHIAKQPPAIEQLYPHIPSAIASIIMKLMAKNAEDRYQTAKGILADLEICREQFTTTGEIIDFTPGRLDILSQLLIPQKLYGRETQINLLLEAFERVSKGSSEMMLVSGYSGIGKSSVVNEVNKPITRQKGYFISGKFDQFKRNIPYASLILAFSSLMRQLLTENAIKLEEWREKILEAVGSNGQVIIDVIPEVELIIGQQPELVKLGGIESQNRFNRVFTDFIQVFPSKQHPLVIFLDDLQWADSATLKLMQLLITDPSSKYMLLIGAYRDNEVSPTHPLIQTIEEIDQSTKVINNIVLQPLALNSIIQLVAETLKDNTERVNDLAELICNKTGGNPFFLTQLLQTLYQEKFFKFDFSNCQWQWSIEEIQTLGITDKNVVELVASHIQKLPESTQKVLQLAACIGDQFSLDVLSIVNEKSLTKTASTLYSALQAGLILPLNDTYRIPLVFDEDIDTYKASPQSFLDNIIYKISGVSYKFLHDRVQQAAYYLIPESEKQSTHLKIGQLLLKQTPSASLTENILDIVNQLNVGVDLLQQQSEKEELARLNLLAGQKAKDATAYEAAAKYLNVGLGLLTSGSWQYNYDMTLSLHIDAAEAEYLNGNFNNSEKISEIALQNLNNILEKIKVYEIKIQSYLVQNRLNEALDIGVKILAELEVKLPYKPNISHFVVSVLQTKLALVGKKIENLYYLPEMTDPYKLAAMKILLLITPAASQSGSLYFPLAVLAMVRLSVKYGKSAAAAYGYMLYGALLCNNFGDIEGGYRFGKLGISLVKPMNVNLLKFRVYHLFNAMIRHFKEPIKTTISPLVEGINNSLEAGDLEFASYNAWCLSINLFVSGNNLDSIESKIDNYIDIVNNFNLKPISLCIASVRQHILNFQGKSLENIALIGDAFNEETMLPSLGNNSTWLSILYLCKTRLSYFFGSYNEAIKNTLIAKKYQETNPGFMFYYVSNFYHSLAMLALFTQASHSEQKQYLKQIKTNQKQMKKWAHHAPCNYQNKYDLVAAEKARVLGHKYQTMDLYDRAIAGAKENGFTHEEALGNELAAKFYLEQGKEQVAKTYMTEAYYCYVRWGALAKAQDLEKHHRNLIIRSQTSPESPQQDITNTIVGNLSLVPEKTSSNHGALDMATFIKAAEAITSEIVLDNLLRKLLTIILENAAAQKGCLILLKDKQLFIEAIDTSDKESTVVLQSTPVETSQDVPISLIHYVARTQQPLVLNNATQETISQADPYIQKAQPKSVLCAPILYQSKFIGIVYLENNQSARVFTEKGMEILKLLTSQAAIAIENARLYAYQQEKSQELQQSLEKLQQTQAQLVQTEKISSLGQLVAGVAHEVNNPVSFIIGNLDHVSQSVDDLIHLLELYQNNLTSPPKEIAECIEDIELEYLLEDLPNMISSMQVGADRVLDIMESLRNYSRVDSPEKKPTNIHQGIETTLMILQNRLKAKKQRPAIQIVKEFGDLPEIKCYPGQLNQVFMNLLANAIDALDESNQGKTYKEIEKSPNIITIRTKIDREYVIISISDNGPGMTESVRQKLFEPFFTTKPEGKGTGLGLSITTQIVTEKHSGTIECISDIGKGAEFLIKIPFLVENNNIGW